MDFAGVPLDVTFEPSGAVWRLGEFAMQVARLDSAGAMSRQPYPLKLYTAADGSWLGWTKPFKSSITNDYASSSGLGESIVAAGSTSVWAAQGGSQDAAVTQNHSLLVRYDQANPSSHCAVPLPGDNNEVIGLAYDSTRDRIWFAESTGDHHTLGSYSTIGWVKAAGLGARCQNSLDYGGDPRRTPAEEAPVRAAAQTTIDALQCTTAQESDPAADCVHIVTTSNLPPGATHLVYDSAADALWISNWCDSRLRKYSIGSGTFQTFVPPDGYVTAPTTTRLCPDIAWQIASNASDVYYNLYETNRILRFTKATQKWSKIDIPVTQLVRPTGTPVPVGAVETHSIALGGGYLWFTISDEADNGVRDGVTALGRIATTNWSGSSPKGTFFTGWESLPMHSTRSSGAHSFRGVDISGGKVALADEGDFATVVLTAR